MRRPFKNLAQKFLYFAGTYFHGSHALLPKYGYPASSATGEQT